MEKFSTEKYIFFLKFLALGAKTKDVMISDYRTDPISDSSQTKSTAVCDKI